MSHNSHCWVLLPSIMGIDPETKGSQSKRGHMSADLILFNSRIGFANGYETATSVAIGNGRFIVIGDDDETAALAGPDTRKIDLGGRRVLPGMIDSHFHVHEWALNRKNLALTDLTALAELQGLIQSRAAVEPAGAWIVGQGFNETDWDRPHMPTAADLDAVAPHHPVIIWRCDMHLAVANSRALRLAGITANTPDPPDGIIDRDAHGRPTGVLRELAIDAVRNVIAMPKDDVVMDALQDAVGALHRLGLTGVQDIRLMGGREGADALRAWQKLDAAGRLDMRCWVSLPGERLDAAIALGLQSGFGNDRLRIGHVKYFADGGMGARTAWMLSPYLDGGCGQAQMPMDALGRAIARAEQSGLAVMVHAVGDRAGREVIGLMETHAGKHAWLPMPHSIEHLQMLNGIRGAPGFRVGLSGRQSIAIEGHSRCRVPPARRWHAGGRLAPAMAGGCGCVCGGVYHFSRRRIGR
jgi:predicted amidohydrolase YtcJ